MAHCIRQLDAAWRRGFDTNTELRLEEFYRFASLPEYELFNEAAIVSGFVCTDFANFFPFERVHANPTESIAELNFTKLRHYIHTIQRGEKWSSEFSTTLWSALASGSLQLVAQRLESDMSLYEDSIS